VYCDTIKTVLNIKGKGVIVESAPITSVLCDVPAPTADCLLRVPSVSWETGTEHAHCLQKRDTERGGGGVIYHSGTIFTMGGICVILNG
jgi:hypothetical protein